MSAVNGRGVTNLLEFEPDGVAPRRVALPPANVLIKSLRRGDCLVGNQPLMLDIMTNNRTFFSEFERKIVAISNKHYLYSVVYVRYGFVELIYFQFKSRGRR